MLTPTANNFSPERAGLCGLSAGERVSEKQNVDSSLRSTSFKPTGQSLTLGETMYAKDAQDGQRYNIPARGQQPGYAGAVCNGWNHTKEWLLFVVSDERGKRKVTLVMPMQSIQAVD
jgi:hypothetical protein